MSSVLLMPEMICLVNMILLGTRALVFPNKSEIIVLFVVPLPVVTLKTTDTPVRLVHKFVLMHVK
jgi:hypothetical protein